MRWISGLDGLRALAVIAVVVFHLDAGLLPGGFLGVDLFFVLSGYLITRLLVTEWRRSGRIALGRFYLRRARRLLPAVGVLLVVVAVAGSVVWTDQRATLTGGVLSSMGYVTNWWMIADSQSYFVATGRPPMVQHLWSLAIEEQFYLLWAPIVVALVGAGWVARTRIGRRAGAGDTAGTAGFVGRARVIALVAGAGALASTAAMAWIAEGRGIPLGADSGRVYFGSDTHAMGLLLGAAAGALAAVAVTRRATRTSDLLAVAALGGLAWFFVAVDEYQPWLYRGGFLVFSAVALVAILAAARPGSRIGAALDRQPLRWIGQRSYGIYLWHWPVAVVTRPLIDIVGPPWLIQPARAGLAIALAALSYRYVEQPIRMGRGRAEKPGLVAAPPAAPAHTRWSARRAFLAATTRPGFSALSAVASCAAVLAVAAIASPSATSVDTAAPWTWAQDFADTSDEEVDVDDYVEPDEDADDGAEIGADEEADVDDGAEIEADADPGASAPVATTTAQPPTASAAEPAPSPRKTAEKKSAAKKAGAKKSAAKSTVSAFGDSVLLGAAPALQAKVRQLRVNAEVGRQSWDTLDEVKRQAKRGTVAKAVIIHTGNNGIIPAQQLTDTLKLLRGHRIVLVTPHVDRSWVRPNLATIKAAKKHFKNVAVVDWDKAAADNPRWFGPDGMHVNGAGAKAYAKLIARALA